MASLTFTFAVPCMLCGHRNTGMRWVWGVRINKRSIRGGRSLQVSPWRCEECGWPLPDSMQSPRLHPDTDSLATINETRQRKGWTTAPRTDRGSR